MHDFFLYTTYANDNIMFLKEGITVGKTKKEITWKNPSDEQDNWKRWATGKNAITSCRCSYVRAYVNWLLLQQSQVECGKCFNKRLANGLASWC